MQSLNFFQDKNRSVRLNYSFIRCKNKTKAIDHKYTTKKQINKSEHSSDADFPKTLVLQYSKQRGQAYLLCSDGNRSGPAAVAAILISMNEAKVRIRTGMVSLCRRLRSRSATLAIRNVVSSR